MEEKNKITAYIGGTFNEERIEDVKKLLEYLGHDVVYDNRKEVIDDMEIRRYRISLLLHSDIYVISDNLGGKYAEIFEMESKIAKHLNKPFIHFDAMEPLMHPYLENLVANKLINELSENVDENKEEETENE